MEERLQYLFRKYLQNTSSRKELLEFFAYIRQARHDDVLRDLMKNLYGEIREGNDAAHTYVNESGNLVLFDQPILTPSTPVKKTKRTKTKLAGAAALLGIAMTGGVLFFRTAPDRATPAPHSATAGVVTKALQPAYKKIMLPDGTNVLLNDGSTLDFPHHFAKTKREVNLHGEAFFDVKHAERSPFIIHTGDIATTVLGTAFNIKAWPGQQNVIVSVSRGKVKISRANKPVIFLTKGQQATIGKNSPQIIQKNIAIAAVAAWQNGSMQYDDERFEDIVADMQRTYHVSISIAGMGVRNLKITTAFSREIGVEQALQILCKLTDTTLKENGSNYIIQ